jgi:hypothetical protein
MCKLIQNACYLISAELTIPVLTSRSYLIMLSLSIEQAAHSVRESIASLA